MVFFLLRRWLCLRSLDFYFFIVFLSVKILHSKMKAGANLALTRPFSHSNGIGLSEGFFLTHYPWLNRSVIINNFLMTSSINMSSFSPNFKLKPLKARAIALKIGQKFFFRNISKQRNEKIDLEELLKSAISFL